MDNLLHVRTCIRICNVHYMYVYACVCVYIYIYMFSSLHFAEVQFEGLKSHVQVPCVQSL